ncbi:NADPH dehydrogenase NamA [Thermosediminibacter oceani]|uniref:NADH:flavin oxidoreductase/NADH oxidase n=1 Tax=Thermosediminibacter oceani (strain ATCC BAA-1034 / DSM 16646 / JW/IW-1228P) TaxID=555079 RepID=D9S0B5_THEOJ|nr:NADPH dehydrogenase NamA [Thermosediminibacter oceani]ADL07043.1 NADH:flavin oxidoreductase/NADH oxidase [Thermosediminibacter oceani DSM 16646]
MSKLFSKIKIKDMEVRNRIVMPPMCMYSSDDKGFPNSWHLIHYATRAIGGVGLVIMEATAVEKRGRISERDLGIWDDAHIEGLAEIASEVKKHGAKIGIQLAHAGRKCGAPGEDLIAPSPIAFDETYGVPREMTKEDIKEVVSAFKAAAYRAYRAGFDIIEIHGAHGYLISEFLSPLTNKRTDEYGGNLQNRARFLREVIRAVREVWPEEKPLMVRVSAEDYAEGGNHDIDLANIINLVKGEGVDIIDVSSGAVVPATIKAYPGYQVRFAETIRKMTGLPVIAGGLITVPEMAEEILQNERADMVYLGRELLRNPYWPLSAAKELGDDIKWPEQYERSRK